MYSVDQSMQFDLCAQVEWRTLCTERGLAQGRPLSPALAAILLQPCIAAAWEAMKADQGLDDAQARRVMGATGYLDDVALIGEPHVVAAGLAAFR
eukprot:COSAG06_NODE_1004_length_11128_cov_5.572944_13_plen_94_part_01